MSIVPIYANYLVASMAYTEKVLRYLL